MLPSSPRKALLANPPSLPWNLPSFTVKCTLSFPCPHPDLPLTRKGAALPHLHSLSSLHDLMIWTNGSVVLANCSLYDTKAALFFSACPVCSSFSAEACTILHALCRSRQLHQVCHFSSLLLFDSRSVLTTLSSPPSFLLPRTRWQIWQVLFFLSSCSIRLQWVPRHSFLPGNDAADELARQGALLAPSAIPCSVSPFISRIHYSLFSDWKHTVSSKFFDTQVSSISTEEFVLLRHSCCVLCRVCSNGLSQLLSCYLFRIGRIENSSCRACRHLSQDPFYLILHCPATDSLPLTVW